LEQVENVSTVILCVQLMEGEKILSATESAPVKQVLAKLKVTTIDSTTSYESLL
jgi:hypothetical protein